MLCQAALALLSFFTAFIAAEVRFYNFTIHEGEAAPDGFSRPVYLINGQQPAPHIEANEDDILEVYVKNELPVETTLHWHGILQRGTPQMDGVPGVTQYPIAPGGNFTYRFKLDNEYGFYWYHSHFRAYYNDAIRGPITILPKRSRTRPFESIASCDADVEALLQAERHAFPVLLTDWYHDVSDVVLREYNRTGVFPHCVNSLLANGMGRVQCLPREVLDCGPDLCLGSERSSAMSMSSSGNLELPRSSSAASQDMALMDDTASSVSTTELRPMTKSVPSSSQRPMGSMPQRKRQMMDMSDMATSLGPRGCTPPTMFRPGYNASDLPPETCTKTMAPLLTIPANSSSGWLALNLVNAGSTSKLTVSLDSHTMYVYAADGLFVKMQEIEVLPIGLGERYSVMIKLDQTPGDYLLRFAATPVGDMQQVIEDVAVVRYKRSVNESSFSDIDSSPKMTSNMKSSILAGDTSGVHMLANSSARTAASILRRQNLGPFDRIAPPIHNNNVVTKNLNVSQTGIVTWVVDRYAYSEPKIPVLNGNISDGWNANTTLHLPFNATIDLIMRISPDSMDTMGHPMHLHGHKFWILGSGEGDFPYSSVQDVPGFLVNLDDPPYRDTVELPASGWAVIRYVSDNPGAWLLHCHIQWHLVSGMALVLVEGGDRLPAILGSSDVSTNLWDAVGHHHAAELSSPCTIP
ncbi:hypothetical protein WHR41_09162 [Cladosporium halotolerans]|uniref:Laccase n=1 Tax=Cladosporium halotolerans TaxID=1052096 RepID=A0AB34KBP9_9PEZI